MHDSDVIIFIISFVILGKIIVKKGDTQQITTDVVKIIISELYKIIVNCNTILYIQLY